jgi:peroxidase
MRSFRGFLFLTWLIADITLNARAEDRTIDGTGNSLLVPLQGSANRPFIRFGYQPQFFGANGGLPSETQRANARDVSNAVFAQSSSRPSARNLSNYIWAWGQFLTHDMDLSTTSAGAAVNGTAGIPVHSPTDLLGPNPIPFTRSNFVGSALDAARTPINEVTSYIDASNVYGSDAVRAAALRTGGGTGAKLLTDAYNLMPRNTLGLPNENNGPVPGDQLFLAGDIRSNENSLLTAMHTLFVREHNRLVDRIEVQQPELNDEQKYQLARKLVGAELQAITYREFLPALLGTDSNVPRAEQYVYQSGLDASITTAFSHAAFRFGHSAVTSQLELRDGNVAAGSLSLRDVFANPNVVGNDPGMVERLLSGAASQRSEEIDSLVIDDLRSFLFGPPGAGGLDLASLNIQRARDAGLPTMTRLARPYQVQGVSSFSQLTSDPALATTLASLYGTVSNADAWVVGLAQDHVPGASMGDLFKSIIQHQFRRLRDGDRLFYRANEAGLYANGILNPEIASLVDLDNLRLSDILNANAGSDLFQQNVFFIPGTGDFNNDGRVDAADYTVWRDTMGQTGEGLAADADHSGKIDLEDYNLWKQVFGSQYGSTDGGFLAAVPEPSSVTVAVFAVILCGRIVRRRTSL